MALGTWWRRLQGSGYYAYFRLVNRTARFHLEGNEHLEAARASGRPILWSLWHGQTQPFLHYGYRYLDPSSFTAITVGDTRADVLTTLANWMGADRVYSVDMSGNPMAAGRSVLRVIHAMRAGQNSVMAPDGPDGPADVPKAGVAFLARKARAAVLPLGGWTRQAIVLDRWDRYLLALPFARFHLVIGEPILADESMDAATLLERIAAALTAARARAQMLARGKP